MKYVDYEYLTYSFENEEQMELFKKELDFHGLLDMQSHMSPSIIWDYEPTEEELAYTKYCTDPVKLAEQCFDNWVDAWSW